MRIPKLFQQLASAILVLASTHSASSQDASGTGAPKKLGYDVVSIKQSAVGETSRLAIQADSLIIASIDLKSLIASAFDTRDRYILGLPSWALSAHYDISAKILGATPEQLSGITDDDRMAMLRQLLSQYFGLATHPEQREVPVYALICKQVTCALGPGTHAAEAVAGLGDGMILMNNGLLQAKGNPSHDSRGVSLE